MADPTEEPYSDDLDEGGGPVKTFLEHLEDLRWMLIKSGSALLIGMIVCLYGTGQIVSILKRPLSQAALIQVGHEQKVIVRFGTNTLAEFTTPTHTIGAMELGTNPFVVAEVEPVASGTNILLQV